MIRQWTPETAELALFGVVSTATTLLPVQNWPKFLRSIYLFALHL
jgi:hypothetical protein